jgi:hypothetical protein
MNADAAVSKNGRGGAVGVVGASTLAIQGIVDPAVLESLACREALALAQDLALQRVTIATYCIAVVNDMNRHMEATVQFCMR